MNNGAQLSKNPLNRRIRTVLYDDQRFSEAELDLLHSPPLQRLYDLHQLGLTDRVFLDASHSRLHHVVGVVEQADNIMEAIISDLSKRGEDKLPYGRTGETTHTKSQIAKIAREKKPAVRLMALLHDLTHAPFGHTLEDEIHLAEIKHDEPVRQANAFYRLLIQYFGWIERNQDATAWGATSSNPPKDKNDHSAWLEWYLDAPTLRVPPETDEFIAFLSKRWRQLFQPQPKAMKKVSSSALEQLVRDLAFALRALLYLDIAHKNEETAKSKHIPAVEYPMDRLLKGLLEALERPLRPDDEFEPRRDVFLLDVIGNTICADLLDYARRDATAAGLKIDYDPVRIVGNMTVIPSYTPPFNVKGTDIEYPFAFRCLRTAISVFSHKLRTDVPGELINLLQARYFVYERMLYHPTKCVAGALLGAAVQFIGWRTIPEHLCYVGDAVFLHEGEEAAKIVRDLLAGETLDAPYTRGVADRLKARLITNSETAVAARAILDDRVATFASATDFLTSARELPVHRDAAAAALELVKDGGKADIFDESALAAFEKQLAINGSVAKLVRRAMPTIGAVHDDMRAALRLLGRLRARRYHKIVFRMLPDVRVVGLRDLTVDQIAAKFLNPHIRKLAEREIEKRVNPVLPLGSIVIHCPPAAGPAKLANILMTDGEADEQGSPKNEARLREIGKLNSKIFGEHQKAVIALEKMYASTWRLAVSVARPHDARWPEIEAATGKVLFEILTGGDVLTGKVPNDLYLQRELKLATERSVAVTEQEATPRTEVLQDGLADTVLATLRGSGRFDDLLASTASYDPKKFLSRITQPPVEVPKQSEAAKAALLERLFPTPASVDSFVSAYIRPGEVKKADQAAYKDLKAGLLRLGPKGQAFVRERIAQLLPPGGLNFNRAILDELIAIISEARGLDGAANKN